MKLKAYPLLRHFLHLLNDMSERNKKKRCLIYHSSEEEGDDDVHEDSSDYSSRYSFFLFGFYRSRIVLVL